MSKQATIASLVRIAAKSEAEFVETVSNVVQNEETDRVWEFFDRLNIPRSQGAEGTDLEAPLPELAGAERDMTFAEEFKVTAGVQRFLDRHEKKIKWHATRPSAEGADNVLLLFRACMMTTNLRLLRLKRLLASKDELTPDEWSGARSMMNNSYLSFRNFLQLVASDWVDAVGTVVPRDDLVAKMGRFHELVDGEIQRLEQLKDNLEERRRELTVLPEGYPPVKPPIYFHGDLLGKGPWKLFWNTINGRAHHFRETMA